MPLLQALNVTAASEMAMNLAIKTNFPNKNGPRGAGNYAITHLRGNRAGVRADEQLLRPVSGPGSRRRAYFIVGMENSAPSLTPEGQREVTVLVRV